MGIGDTIKNKLLSWAADEAARDSRTAEKMADRVLVACTTAYRYNVSENAYTGYRDSGTGRGNYTEYSDRVNELTEMWTAETARGRGITRSIIGYRTAFIFGDGASVSSPDAQVDKFCKQYFEWNQLSWRGLYERIKIGEIEGRVVGNLNLETDRVKAAIYRYYKYPYSFNAGKYPGEIESIEIPKVSDAPIPRDRFIYVPLGGGFLDEPDDQPSIAQSLIDDLKAVGAAFEDWRASNRVFGQPARHLNPKDLDTAKWLYSNITTPDGSGGRKIDYSIGQTTIFPGAVENIEQTGAASGSIERELANRIRGISGTSCIPIYMLGWSSEMSNRATALELAEVVNIGTQYERRAWEFALAEECEKAIKLWNRGKNNTKIPEDKPIIVSIPLVQLHWIKLLGEIYGNLQLADIISKDQLREMMPGIDVERAKREIEKDRKAASEAYREFEIPETGDLL